MIFVLIILLFVELLIAYNLNGKRLFSPSFVSIGVFLVSSLVYSLSMENLYGTDIHLVTVIVIPAVLMFIIIGERAAILAKKRQLVLNHFTKRWKTRTFSINAFMILFFALFVLAISLWYAYDVYIFSLSLGNSQGNFFSATEFVRHSTNYGDGNSVYSSGTFLSQALLISKCIIFFCFFVFVNDSLSRKRPQFRYLLPFLGYIVYVIFCDSRGYLIQDIVIFIAIIFNRLSFFHVSKRKLNRIILATTIVSLIVFILIFRTLGFRTGTSLKSSFSFNLADYMSSGLLGLDKMLTSGFDSNGLFAQGVLRNVYIKLNDFGLNFHLGSSNRDFFNYLSGRSNVYTGLLTLIIDFNVLCCVFLLVWSFILQLLLDKPKPKNELIHCFVIGTLFYPLSMISIGGEWANVLSMTTIYQIVYLFLLGRLFSNSNRSFYRGEFDAKRIQDCANWRRI